LQDVQRDHTLVFSPQVSDLFTIWLSQHSRSFLEGIKDSGAFFGVAIPLDL
jgi:hypothetical protein